MEQNYYKLNSIRMSSSILFPTNEYTTSNKSSQEIQKLMMPEESALEALRMILTKGHPLQQPYAYSNFHIYPCELLEHICAKLPKENTDNQILIVESLKKLKDTQLDSRQIRLIFECVVQSLRNWSGINNQYLVDALETVIEMSSDRSELLKALQKVVLEMGKHNEPTVSKVIAGRLVPVLSKYTGRTIKGEMIDIVKRIIGDSEIEAKKVWVTEIFPKLLQNLKLEFIELHLQEKIYETVYDENEEIGLMALEVILRNTTKFSLEEQGSRIVKLFIDSMTSKNEKIALMATSFMGQTFQKLQGIILKNQSHCMRFWKSLIEVAQSKNQKILNNFIFNLPGILLLSKKYHRVDPVCEIYAELFYNPESDTLLLVSYFHQMVKMFPTKLPVLRQTAYNLLNEIFEEAEPNEEAMRIVDCLLLNLYNSKEAFLEEVDKEKDRIEDLDEINIQSKHEIKTPYFETTFNQFVFKYLNLCLARKNGNYIGNLYSSIAKCHDLFSPIFTEISLLPKLYSAIRAKSAYLHELVKLIIMFLVRDCSTNSLVNNYVSKINVELSKSTKSHEREAAMLFFYYSSFEFSVDTFQEFKMGEKFLQFSNQKCLKNKLNFIEFMPRINYLLTKDERIESTIILNRLRKDQDAEVILKIERTDFSESEQTRNQIVARSKEIKEKEKIRGTLAKKSFMQNRREPIKDLKKQQVLKKRVETRSRTKMLIKQVSKKKTPMSITRPILRKNS